MLKHILFLLLFIFASCKTVEKQKPKDFNNLTLQDFYGEEWELESFAVMNGNIVRLSSDGNQHISLTFKDGNTIVGKGFCNSYFGNYEMNGDSIRFSNIVATKRFCGDISNESRFFKELAEVKTFVLYKPEEIHEDKFRLFFYNTGRTKALWFTRDTVQSF